MLRGAFQSRLLQASAKVSFDLYVEMNVCASRSLHGPAIIPDLVGAESPHPTLMALITMYVQQMDALPSIHRCRSHRVDRINLVGT